MSDTPIQHNTTLSVRVTANDRSLLNKVCKARGEDISDFVRLAIRKELAALSFLPDEDKKALGIKEASHSV
jgi:uncharacterized protein (DUF1778 family)